MLIDAFIAGLVKKPEFASRVTGLRARLDKLEAEVPSGEAAENWQREMRPARESLEAFAAEVRGGLENADRQSQRNVIAALVEKVEIGKEEIRVVHKVDVFPFKPSPPDQGAYGRTVGGVMTAHSKGAWPLHNTVGGMARVATSMKKRPRAAALQRTTGSTARASGRGKAVCSPRHPRRTSLFWDPT